MRIIMMNYTVAAFLTLATTVNAANIFKDSFESQNFNKWHSVPAPSPSAMMIDNARVQSGSWAARCTLRKTDPLVSNSKRSELTAPKLSTYGNPNGGSETYVMHYNLHSGKFAKDWSYDIIGQWHATPDNNGEPFRSPPLSLQVENDKWRVKSHSDSKAKSTVVGPNPKYLFTSSSNVEKDQWVKWELFVKWNYNGNGQVKGWKNGALQFQYNGAIGFNDQGNIYMKVGCYKPQWKKQNTDTTIRRLWMDGIKIID